MLIIHKEFNLPDVMVHGDMYLNNVLLSKAHDQKPTIIDWQVIHAGSPMEDICRLLSASVNYEIREHHMDELLYSYYDALVHDIPDYASFEVVKRLQLRGKYRKVEA